jgi:hypothetical protein
LLMTTREQLRNMSGYLRGLSSPSVTDADLKRGDELRVQCGALEGLRGIFDRRTRSSTRVLMLLKAVSYHACAEVEELQVSKVS